MKTEQIDATQDLPNTVSQLTLSEIRTTKEGALIGCWMHRMNLCRRSLNNMLAHSSAAGYGSAIRSVRSKGGFTTKLNAAGE